MLRWKELTMDVFHINYQLNLKGMDRPLLGHVNVKLMPTDKSGALKAW